MASPELIRRVIEKTSYEFEKVKDFEAKMSVALKDPGLRMPKKEYITFFVKIQNREFMVQEKLQEIMFMLMML